MKKQLVAAIGGLFAAGALLPAHATLSQVDYQAGKARAEAEYKVAKERCAPLAGNAKDICQAEAKGQFKIAKADF